MTPTKKILLILDDVDKEEQIQCIVGRPNWFGPGSRVIITTRDKHLLACHRVEKTHEVEELNKNAAIELLRWEAFKNDKVRPSYVDILNRALPYASGLPLALEVIGSNWCGKNTKGWESALEQYERIPDKKIQKILKVSFDALEEEEQSIFLDIACCFKGYKLKEVETILNAHHDQCIKYHIRVLVEKSLIKISWGEITLHDLLEHMGKEIVRQESPKEPGKRSRLWSHEDIFEVLEENTKFLTVKVLNLDSCPYLSQIPDISSLPNLEELSFEKCEKLITIDHSVGSLGKLKILNAVGCKQLRSFPPLKLPFLKELKLSFCSSLESFPEILDKVENITYLDLEDTYIRKFSSTFRNLTRLRTLNVSHLLPLRSLVMMPQVAKLTICEETGWMLEIEDEGEEKVSSNLLSSNVRGLRLAPRDLSHGSMALILSWFPNLKELDLHDGTFTIVPECIKECCFLLKLILNGCNYLKEIEGIPPSLKYLYALGCYSLSSSCIHMLLKQEFHEAEGSYFILPSLETEMIPEWFEHQSRGPSPSLSFWCRNKFPDDILLCLDYANVKETFEIKDVDFIVNGKVLCCSDSRLPLTAYPCHTCLINILWEDFTGDAGEAL